MREFFDRELPEAKIREMDRARRIPRELWKRFAELGWMGLSVPERFGGSGADVMTAAVLTEELARRFPSLATDWVLVSMTARVFVEAGTAAQQERLLPALARGEFLMAFGMTEPDGGTDVLGLKTRAALGTDGWAVRGQKLYTSLADDADAILVLVPHRPRRGGQARPRPVAGADAAPSAGRAGAPARADGHARGVHLRGVPRRRARLPPTRSSASAAAAGTTCSRRSTKSASSPAAMYSASRDGARPGARPTRGIATPSDGRSAASRRCSTRSPTPPPSWSRSDCS